MAAATTRKDEKPLPLNGTLRDLALLRATDVDFSSLIPSENTEKEGSDVDASVARSYEFAQAAREAIRIRDRESVEEQGARVESLRRQLEEIAKGLGVGE